MNHSYEIRDYKYGKAIIGSVPLEEAATFMKLWDKQGYKLMDLVIPEYIGASLVVVRNQEDRDAWLKELGIGPENTDWLKSGDCGLSSKTIFAIMTNRYERGFNMDKFTTPSDSWDFGRCYRLLQRFPEYRARLNEVAEKVPAWKPLVENWDALCSAFEKETKGDKEIYSPVVTEMLWLLNSGKPLSPATA